MEKAFAILLLVFAPFIQVEAQSDRTTLNKEASVLQSKQKALERSVLNLTRKNKVVYSRVAKLEAGNDSLRQRVDSLENVCKDMSSVQKADKDTLSTQIGKTKSDVELSLSSRTSWGIAAVIVLLCAIAAIVWLFMRKLKSGSASIDEVR